MSKFYDVLIKELSGWSSIDSIDAPATKEDYIEILEADNERELADRVRRADEFKLREINA